MVKKVSNEIDGEKVVYWWKYVKYVKEMKDCKERLKDEKNGKGLIKRSEILNKKLWRKNEYKER